MTPIYRIHPAIGVARLGDSTDEFCLAAEAPAAKIGRASCRERV